MDPSSGIVLQNRAKAELLISTEERGSYRVAQGKDPAGGGREEGERRSWEGPGDIGEVGNGVGARHDGPEGSNTNNMIPALAHPLSFIYVCRHSVHIA